MKGKKLRKLISTYHQAFRVMTVNENTKNFGDSVNYISTSN